MKRKLFVVLSLMLMVSMILSACSSTQSPTAAEQPTTAPAAENTQTPAEATPATGAAGEAPAAEATTAPEPVQAPTTDRKGGWLDTIIFSAIPEVNGAVEQLEASAIDMYPVAAEDAAVYEAVQGSQNVGYSNNYGSSNQIILNTSACTDTSLLNPFTNMKIREAMNWAIDRDYVAQELMDGLAVPKYTVMTGAFLDFARYADLIGPIETKYAYDLSKAQEVVDEEMAGLGAEKGADGKWQYNGKPVVLTGIIRTEDARREIGNYFAAQLEQLGFTVDPQEKLRAEASPIWQGDPKECKFHFYTAGWINNVVSRDDGNNFLQYNTGEVQNIQVMNEYQPSEELYDVSKQLINNTFSTLEERRELFAKALELSMTESWWGVWVTDNISFSPYRNGIEGAYDLAGGYGPAQLFPYTLRWEGEEGGEMRLAQSGIMVDPWNPINGSNFTDDGTIQNFTQDYGLIYDPYTGLSMPKLINKMEVVAQEGLPVVKSSDYVDLSFEKEIPIPEDAWADWDATNQKFLTVGEVYPDGVMAKTKTTIHYIPELYETKWHDGSNFSAADVVMSMIMEFDQAKKESKIYDESAEEALATTLDLLKGFKIVSTDPLVIEIYQNGFSMDAENTVNGAYDFTFYPTYNYGPAGWHNLIPAILAEENGELAFSDPKSGELKVDWTGFLAGPSVETQTRYLEQAAAEKYVPYAATLGEFLTDEEITTRYENLKKWVAEKKHFWIGTGPYYIDQVFPVEGTIVVKRYEDYMFPADMFADLGSPKLITASVEGPVSVNAGTEAAFDVYVNFGDQPYPQTDIERVTYTLYNANNEVVGEGEAEMVAEGVYQVVLSADQTSAMEAGSSKVTVAVSSRVVSIPSFTTYEFVVAK